MLLTTGARLRWSFLILIHGAAASALDAPFGWLDLNDTEVSSRHEDVEFKLSQQVDQYMADAFGIQGIALMAFILAAVMLVRGGWLLTDFPGRRVSWFIMGSALAFFGMVYVAMPQADVAAQLQLAISISCHSGVVLALFPEAGCYIIGAGATALAIHLVHEGTVDAKIHAVHAQGELAVVQLAAGVLGGYLCNRFRKPALDFVFSLAGSAVIVLMIHWWFNEAFHWCFSPNDFISSPLQYWTNIWSLNGSWNLAARWCFSSCWLVTFWFGQRLRQRLDITESQRQHRRMQEQLRRAPNDCDRMPWNPNRASAPVLPDLEGQSLKPSAPEEEDFGMYLLPEDLESMKRSKSILGQVGMTCFKITIFCMC